MKRLLIVLAGTIALAAALSDGASAACAVPYCAAPLASTAPVGAVTPTTAVVNGVVNPNGSATSAWFEVGGTPAALAAASPAATIADGPAAPVSARLTGLTPNTTYVFRVHATNAGGSAFSDVARFTTAPRPAPAPTAAQLRHANAAASRALGGGPVKQLKRIKLGAARLLAPSGGAGAKGPTSISGSSATLDTSALGRSSVPLEAAACPTADCTVTVDMAAALPQARTAATTLKRQTLKIAKGHAKAIRLQITKAMRRTLRAGRKVKLTIGMAERDALGNHAKATQRLTLKAGTPKRHRK